MSSKHIYHYNQIWKAHFGHLRSQQIHKSNASKLCSISVMHFQSHVFKHYSNLHHQIVANMKPHILPIINKIKPACINCNPSNPCAFCIYYVFKLVIHYFLPSLLYLTEIYLPCILQLSTAGYTRQSDIRGKHCENANGCHLSVYHLFRNSDTLGYEL